jgi:hypothetical protein
MMEMFCACLAGGGCLPTHLTWRNSSFVIQQTDGDASLRTPVFADKVAAPASPF